MEHDHSPTFLCAPNPALARELIASLLAEEDEARRAAATGVAPGAVTGMSILDDELGGFLAPGVHTLLAAPGAGKTALSLQIAACCGCPALYVSAEMRRAELLRRLIARETRTFLGKLRGGKLSHEELASLARRTAKASPQLALMDAQEAASATSGGAGAQALAERAQALREQFESPHVLVIIDSVTEWAPLAVSESGVAQNEYALAEGAINGLKSLASALRCPVLAIAHRHRAGQNKDADRLHAAKGTGRYEYVSESVWDLERKQPTSSSRESCFPTDLTLLKNRHGAVNTVMRLEFEPRIQRFTAL